MEALNYLNYLNPIEPVVFWVDLFAGAGGTTTGIEKAQANAIVVACVNHDSTAIRSHSENHPNCIHFTEDIRDFAVVQKLISIVAELRFRFPNCIINLHASLECTNYSKAKGGLPRDADSRTLAEHLYMYINGFNPDYVFIENVREFMAWGPLDDCGKPISKSCGIDYIKWIQTVQSFGYNYDFKILNAADFGAYQSRERYFGQFAKNGLPIAWPEATHAKQASSATVDLFGENQKISKWKPVKEILRLDIEGESIFERKKPLVDATLKRILAGLHKFVANGEPSFIKRYNGGDPKEKVKSIENPIGTISTNGRHAIVSTNFLCSYYGQGSAHSIENPIGTVTTKDRYALIFPFIDEQYRTGTARSIESAIGTLTTVPKHNLVQVKQYLLNPQFQSKGSDIEKPCFTLIARMDKMPPYLISANSQFQASPFCEINENDSEVMIQIKQFMKEHFIYDIKMRMLLEEELLQIQGFPKTYVLHGTSAQRKKQIGNAVHTSVQKAITEANFQAITNHFKSVA